MEEKGINIKRIADELNFDDKIELLTGEGSWHTHPTEELPSVKMSDGPTGLRCTPEGSEVAEEATCFPTASALASSWDRKLVFEVGEAIAEEATALGVNVVLAPGVNIKRNPLCGRNFEYFSEDPFLAGEMGGAYIRGIQSEDVGACLKHFAANSQEKMRFISDSVIDERALREIYLAPFERALKAEPKMVMCAYNKLNGEYCSENKWLLRDVLRGEFEFNGVTVSDWGAVHSRSKALSAGIDLMMPSDKGLFKNETQAAVASGAITRDDINGAAERIVQLIDDVYLEPQGEMEFKKHEDIAYRAALGGIVLLKNDGALPATANVKISLMGEVAAIPKYQGGGSSEVNAHKPISAVEAFTERDRAVEFYLGYSDGADEVENVTLRREAVEGSIRSDLCVVFVGLTKEEENVDRADMRLPKYQELLLDALIGAGRKVCVVLCTGCPVEMPWAAKAAAIVQAGLSGGRGALAAVDILTGRQNPQGRLAESYPLKYRDCPSSGYYGGEVADYRESLYVGYRYYDKADVPVRYPFGYGLSYSKVSYNSIELKKTGEGEVTAVITVENKSSRGVYEVVQVYVSDHTDTVHRPINELKGFEKVYVDADSSVTVNIPLDFRAFAFYDCASKKWAVGSGEYEVRAGSSSRDLPLSAIVELSGDGVKDDVPNAYRNLGSFSRADFETLLGRKITEPVHSKPYTTLSTLRDVSGTLAGKFLYKTVLKRMGENQMEAMLDTPLDVMMQLSEVRAHEISAIVDACNRKYFSALKKIITKKI